jgi:hypothetical protein
VDLPRYFTPRPQSQNEGVPATGGVIEHLIDAFVLEGTILGTQDVWVGVDGAGKLSIDVAQGLSVRAQAQLSYHEVSGGRTRSVDAQNVFLFDLQLVEQAPDSPGANDPVFLYGVLYGPLPHVTGGAVPATQGQLTVTRADVLEALVNSTPYAFHYQGVGHGNAGTARPRCFHLTLPGGREDEIAAGRSIVFAYPLLSIDLFSTEPMNEIPVNQLAYDLLSGFWGDLCKEEPRRYGKDKILPPPDRATLVRKLQDDGYSVDGDVASRKRPGLLGALLYDRIDLPADGTVDTYVSLAAEALRTLPSWPDSRARALRTRVRLAGSRTRFSGHPKNVDAGQALPASVAKPKPRKRSSSPPEWMQDFVDAHQQPGRPAPHLTGATAAKPSPQSENKTAPNAKPDWMKDFDS